ncbi:MAG: SpoIIE family protein phosphatase, partial [Acidobacteria bacterium]|nr:SpoIIE family protein phosphatase [Acidobacteriota bacterium]
MAALIIQTAGEPSYRILLESTKVRIGRSENNEICLAGDAAVSRFHAEITVVGERYFLDDLGSRNGTFVNGSPVDRRTPLPPRCRIQVGKAVITLTGSPGTHDGDTAPMPEELAGNSVILSAAQVVEAGSLPGGTVSGLAPEAENPHARAFAALSRWAPDLMSDRPLSEVLTLVLDMVFQAIAPERAALLLLEGDPPTLKPGASRGMQTGTDGSKLVSATISARVIGRQQSVLTSDAQIDPRFMEAQSIVQQSVHSAMSVPLWNNSEVIGMIYVDTVLRPVSFSKVDLEVLTLLANLSAIKIDHVVLSERDQKMRELERELQAAAKIQRRLLPGEPPSFAGYDIHGRNDPCHAVGGDYFDFQPRDNGCLGIALGDVSGKGMGAALLMATLQASFRAHAATNASPRELVERLNRAVCANAEANKFITFFYGELDGATHTLHYVNAGHNPPMLFRANGTLEPLRTGGLILGFEPTIRYTAEEVTLAPGDLLLLFTDGVTEAERPDGEEFGEQRLSEIVRRGGQAPAADIAQRIRDEVDAFTHGADA